VKLSLRENIHLKLHEKSVFIGEDAIQKAIRLTVENIIEKGVIQNFDDIEHLWSHTFYQQLHVAP
jgi:actin, other eukaryote